MKTTFRMTVMAAALGMMSGLAAAQEQGATTAAEPTAATTATQVDNGAMPGDSHVQDCAAERCEGESGAGSQDGLGI